LSNLTLFDEGKKNIAHARELCKEIKHSYTMLKNSIHLIELNIATILSFELNDENSLDHQKVLTLMNEAQEVYEDARSITRNYSQQYSRKNIEDKLADMYELGLHSCSRLSYDSIKSDMKNKYKELFNYG